MLSNNRSATFNNQQASSDFLQSIETTAALYILIMNNLDQRNTILNAFINNKEKFAQVIPGLNHLDEISQHFPDYKERFDVAYEEAHRKSGCFSVFS